MNIKTASICILSLYLKSSYAYIPAHLEKITQSEECVGCDLTQLEIYSWNELEIKSINLKASFWTKVYISNNNKINLSGKNLEKANFVLSNI